MFIGKEVNPDFGPRIQRGSGIGGIFSKFLNFIKPGIKSIGKVAKKIVTSEPIKSVAKEALKTTAEAGTNLLGNIILGENPSEAANEELHRVRQNVGTAVKNISFDLPKSKKRKKKQSTKKINLKKNKTLLD